MLIWNSIHKSLKITSGGKKYDLQDSADGACATNWGYLFVTIGGYGWYWRDENIHREPLGPLGYWWHGLHGNVVWWEIWTNISFQFYPSYRQWGTGENCATIPDLLEPRRDHACTTFRSSQTHEELAPHLGRTHPELVWFKKLSFWREFVC